ncbi:MAG: winged helix-turn-helix transcriptional regulator, partial [Propionibacteriaceae bacterium]|nr:winged helix-turn-helix transcriptional regulator [Propionibacteriaceae bacterium]
MTATVAQPPPIANVESAQTGANRAAVVAWMRLARIYTKIDRRTADHLKVYDLSVAQFDVLAQVGAHEGITQRELADVLLVTKGNVTQLLDRMTVRGLVERRPARVGRGNHLFLTPAGWALYRQAVPSQEAMIAACWTALDPAELRTIDRALRTLDRSLD